MPTATTLASLNTDPEFLYSGSPTGLHRSFNNGRNWVTYSTFKKTPVNAIFVNPSNLSKIYVGSGGHLYSSKDGGDSWTNISSFSHKLNGDSGTSIDIKITEIPLPNDKSIYACTTSGIYFSRDAGENWENIDLSGAVNQLSTDEMKMDIIKLVTEIHTGRFFESYFYMLVDLATIGIVFLTISGILTAYFRTRVKNRKKTSGGYGNGSCD